MSTIPNRLPGFALSFDEYVKMCDLRLRCALDEYNPPFIWVAYSGGADSAIVVEIMRRLNIQHKWSVMTIDTGLQSEGHIERVLDDMKRANVPCSVFSGSGLQWWVDNVRQYGYAFTPNQHSVYYRSLKERAIDKAVKSAKTAYHQKILNITGVRRAESARRAKTPLIYATRRARLSCNLIYDLGNDDKADLLRNVAWWKGRTTEDCMCNWHCRFNVRSGMNSAMQSAVKAIDAEMQAAGLWQYGQTPSHSQRAQLGSVDNVDDMPDDALCVNCAKRYG